MIKCKVKNVMPTCKVKKKKIENRFLKSVFNPLLVVKY